MQITIATLWHNALEVIAISLFILVWTFVLVFSFHYFECAN